MRCSKLEFQVNELLLRVSASQVLHGAHSLKMVFVVCLKFRLNWASVFSCAGFGNPE